MNESIALFAYDFPHRKTNDFILDLVASGINNIIVIAAPKKTLTYTDNNSYFNKTLNFTSVLSTEVICNNLNLPYYELKHDDVGGISKLAKVYKIRLGLISGARIIPSEVINIFKLGLINFHPGKIPETSGLDSFYYSIKNSVPMGVTTHFIDHKVDAGKMIAFEELELSADDTIEVVQENLYQLQRKALKVLIPRLTSAKIHSTEIHRPKKNLPLSFEEKQKILLRFQSWKSFQYVRQTSNSLFRFCETGDVKSVESLIHEFPCLINSYDVNGWTPLIVASFNHHYLLVKLLLENGADPNLCGRKGTTPLMYAKTRYSIGDEDHFPILDLLINAGAEVNRLDCYGKSIGAYLKNDTNPNLIKYISDYL